MKPLLTNLRWLVPCTVALLLQGCEQNNGEFVNADWHRKDLNAHLSRWVAVSLPRPG
ncbi:hypothetical protein ACHMW6_01960 [Pseudoduganella sp. UC29_106]|uniref:hypothetical protein n=1 Tax=Pseudoduganella sp. UC29_106 TaxID=3374553 RepID=UPI00375824FA